MSSKDILAAIAARAKNCPMVTIEVPEWGCTLFFPKDITVAQHRDICAGIEPDDELALTASYIFNLAQTKDGKKAFETDARARADMEAAGVKVLRRIMIKIGAPETVEKVKNA